MPKYTVELRWIKTIVLADTPEEAAKKGLELLTDPIVNTVSVSHHASEVPAESPLYIGGFKVWKDGKVDKVD